MKIELFTFCDFAQDNGGKLTIVGTFDTIIAQSFPCTHPQLSVVIRVRFDMWEFTQHNFRIEVQSLQNIVRMDPISGTIDVKDAGNATTVSHLVFSVSNFRVPHEGVTNFVLYIDNKELNSIPLYIRKGKKNG